MMKMTLDLKGLRELDDVLAKELPRAAARGVLRRALLAAAEPMAARARALAPDDPNTIDLDRDLRENIIVSTRATGDSIDAGNKAFSATMKAGGTRAEAGAALRDARKSMGAAQIGAFMGPSRRVFHGIFSEFGTGIRQQHKTGRVVGKMDPHPFMRPAFDSEKDATVRRLTLELSDEINKAVARAKRKAMKVRR